MILILIIVIIVILIIFLFLNKRQENFQYKNMINEFKEFLQTNTWQNKNWLINFKKYGKWLICKSWNSIDLNDNRTSLPIKLKYKDNKFYIYETPGKLKKYDLIGYVERKGNNLILVQKNKTTFLVGIDKIITPKF